MPRLPRAEIRRRELEKLKNAAPPGPTFKERLAGRSSMSKKLRMAITKYSVCGDWDEAAKFAGYRDTNNLIAMYEETPAAPAYLEFLVTHNDDSVFIGVMLGIDGAIQDRKWDQLATLLRLHAELRGMVGRARVLEPVTATGPGEAQYQIHAGPPKSLEIAS